MYQKLAGHFDNGLLNKVFIFFILTFLVGAGGEVGKGENSSQRATKTQCVYFIIINYEVLLSSTRIINLYVINDKG